MRTVHNVIGGEHVSSDGPLQELINPSDDTAFGRAPISTEHDVDLAYRAAAAAFPAWRDAAPAERQRTLLKFAQALMARAGELIYAECQNTGKPISDLYDETGHIEELIWFVAGGARMLEGRSAGEYASGRTSYVRREPVGVIGQVTPWNYPMTMAVEQIVPAIAMGNTVVLKPSDTTPVTTAMIGEIAAGVLPAGVVNIVCGNRDTGRAVVTHPTPAMVSIVGSTRAGIDVAVHAARGVKRAHLELGGNAPVIIFDDADLDAAVESVVIAGYANAGQACTAATRTLVADSAFDEFTAKLVERVQAVTTGPPSDPTAFYGPLNNASQLARVAGFFDRLPDRARVVTGGARLGDQGFFWQPTVVIGLEQHDELIQEEIFGPVVTVQRFSGEDQALQYANDTDYGLAASVWTRDHARALRMSRYLEFGTVWVNTHDDVVSEMPHGGFKRSGYGKDFSTYGLEEYTRIKHVMHNIEG